MRGVGMLSYCELSIQEKGRNAKREPLRLHDATGKVLIGLSEFGKSDGRGREMKAMS